MIGYARISKDEAQMNALQVQALKQAGLEKIFCETASGGDEIILSCVPSLTEAIDTTTVAGRMLNRWVHLLSLNGR